MTSAPARRSSVLSDKRARSRGFTDRGISSARGGQRINFFGGQGGGILEGLPDVLGFQDGIFPEDLIEHHPVRDEVDHEADSHSHATDTGSSTHHLGIECDPIEHLSASRPFRGGELGNDDIISRRRGYEEVKRYLEAYFGDSQIDGLPPQIKP